MENIKLNKEETIMIKDMIEKFGVIKHNDNVPNNVKKNIRNSITDNIEFYNTILNKEIRHYIYNYRYVILFEAIHNYDSKNSGALCLEYQIIPLDKYKANSMYPYPKYTLAFKVKDGKLIGLIKE